MNGWIGKEGGSLRAHAHARATPSLSPLLALGALGVLAALVGCGGSSTATSATVPASPAAAAASVSAADAVATVAGVPIAKAGYLHWLAVEEKLGAAGSPSHQALGFLITSEWVLGEAAGRGMSVSETEVKRRFAQLVHQSFPKPGTLKKYLTQSGETEADLLARIKIELLAARIATHITAGKPRAQRTAVLTAFEHNFQAHWKRLTSCNSGYVMEDCKQYKGAPERPPTPASRPNGPASASSSGEVSPAPGGFTLSSPAFARNAAIPAEYTCAGKGISPPLAWQKVPAHAAALFLFVIDLGSTSSSGGIRWVVGNIDPGSTSVTAGRTPPGGIVGTNTAGKAAYSAICPAHGKSDTIELLMYALSKKISLSSGFSPTMAEAQYGSHKLLMGQAAVTYGVASR